MAVEEPKSIAMGSIDMSLRSLLHHMIDKQLDHTVLVMPGSRVRISITVADERKTAAITAAVAPILRGR